MSQKNLNKIINKKLLYKSENKTQEKLVYFLEKLSKIILKIIKLYYLNNY